MRLHFSAWAAIISLQSPPHYTTTYFCLCAAPCLIPAPLPGLCMIREETGSEAATDEEHHSLRWLWQWSGSSDEWVQVTGAGYRNRKQCLLKLMVLPNVHDCCISRVITEQKATEDKFFRSSLGSVITERTLYNRQYSWFFIRDFLILSGGTAVTAPEWSIKQLPGTKHCLIYNPSAKVTSKSYMQDGSGFWVSGNWNGG